MTILEKLKYLRFLQTLCNGGETDNTKQCEDIAPLTIDDLISIGRDELYKIGFGNWNNNLILLPTWIVPFIEPTATVESINGRATTLEDCDKDDRFGCLAYGFVI